MKKILIYSVLCLIAALPVSAQKFYKDAINITNASLWQQGESLYINMQMDMRNLKVSNDRTLTLKNHRQPHQKRKRRGRSTTARRISRPTTRASVQQRQLGQTKYDDSLWGQIMVFL